MDFDKKQYKVYTWKSFRTLIWVITPIFIINEIIFGQKIPKVILIDKTTGKSLFESSFVPCPHCNTMHDGRTWSHHNKTALKNWFGFYCPTCGKIIPCLNNVFSLIFLALTFPLWGWFGKSLKAKWLLKQPARYQNIEIEEVSNDFDEKNWIKSGLVWGLIMFVIMTFVFPFIFDSQKISWRMIIINAVVWTISGLSFGYIMKRITTKKQKTHQ